MPNLLIDGLNWHNLTMGTELAKIPINIYNNYSELTQETFSLE